MIYTEVNNVLEVKVMKLIIAIVHSDDSNRLIAALNEHKYSVTRLATTGGFLRAGNTTLLIGVDDNLTEDAIDIIREECSTRKQITTTHAPMGGVMPHPIEIEVGGATVFVLDIERFEKL